MRSMDKRVKWWQVVIGLVASAIITLVAITGVNAWRQSQADQLAAQEAAEVQAAIQAEQDALVVKFADADDTDVVKTPPPPPAPVVEEPAVEEPPADAGPILCPPGTSANSSDGYNDTSCYPDICFNISVPDPEHPECDAAFVP